MKNLLLLVLIFGVSPLFAQPSVLLEKAEQLSVQGDYPASNDSLSAFINRYPVKRYEVGAAYFLRSFNHLQMDNLEAAAEDNEASLAIRQALIPEEVGKNLIREGAIALKAGHQDKALKLFSEAEAYPYIDEPEQPALMKLYTGQAFAQKGMMQAARDAYQEATDVLEVVGEDENELQARLYYLIGKTYQSDEQWDEAENWLVRSLNSTKTDWPGKLDVYLALAAVGYSKGDKLMALAYYQEALQYAQQVAGPYSPQLAKVYLNLACFYRITNNKKNGEIAVQKGLQTLCPDFTSEAFGDYPSLEEFCGDWKLFAALMSLKTSFLLQEYALRQDAALLNEAQKMSSLSLDAFERYALIFAGPNEYGDLLQSYPEYYASAISVALAKGEVQGGEKEKQRAFQLAERAKILPKRLKAAQGGVASARQGLEKEKRGLKQNVNEARLKYQLDPSEEKWQNGFYDQRKAYLGFIASLELQDSSHYAERYAMSAPSLAEVQGNLGRREAFISYFLTEEEYFIFAASRRKYEAESLPIQYPGVLTRGEMPEERGLDTMLKEFPRVIAANNTERFAELSPLLYQCLLAPVDKALKRNKALAISPHGRLEGFPFDTLMEKKKDAESYQQLSEADNGYEIRFWEYP